MSDQAKLPESLYRFAYLDLPADRTRIISELLASRHEFNMWCRESLQPGWRLRSIPSVNPGPGSYALIMADERDLILFELRWSDV